MIQSIETDLNHIKSKGEIKLSDYNANRDLQKICERNLETAIQSCLDIGNHIISQDNLGYPESNADIIKILAEKKILPPDYSETMLKMVGLRNKLTHEYRDILNNIIVNVIHNNLDDFDKFILHIKKYCQI